MGKIQLSKPHPRFGATKAQGKRNQELRDRDNHIFLLTQEITRLATYEQEVQVLRLKVTELQSAFSMAKRELEKPVERGMSTTERTEFLRLQREEVRLQGKVDALRELLVVIASGKVTP